MCDELTNCDVEILCPNNMVMVEDGGCPYTCNTLNAGHICPEPLPFTGCGCEPGHVIAADVCSLYFVTSLVGYLITVNTLLKSPF